MCLGWPFGSWPFLLVSSGDTQNKPESRHSARSAIILRRYAECRLFNSYSDFYTECHFAECRGAHFTNVTKRHVKGSLHCRNVIDKNASDSNSWELCLGQQVYTLKCSQLVSCTPRNQGKCVIEEGIFHQLISLVVSKKHVANCIKRAPLKRYTYFSKRLHKV